MSRIINIADGFTSATEPSISGGASSLLENYLDDTAFVAANGTAQKGDIYFNTTTNMVRYFNGTSWENIADNDALTDHINDDTTHGVTGFIVGTTDAQTLINKTIAAVSNTITTAAAGNLTSTELNAALAELQGDIDTRATSSALTAHTGASTGVHGVTGAVVGTTDSQSLTNKTIVVVNNTVTTASSGNLTSTELNAALSELQTDIDTRATSSALTAHTGASTGVHGVSGSVVGTSDSQVITNKDIDGGTASNSRRITLPKDTKANLDLLTRKEANLFYATDDQTVYVDDGSALIEIAGGGGGVGSPDTIYALDADDFANLNDFLTGDNATFLGGGTLSGTFALETSSPLKGTQSFRYTQAAGSLDDYVASPVITVDPIFRGKTVGINFPYRYDGASNDIGVVVYDVTNATVLSPASLNTLSATSTTLNFQTVFTIPSNCTQLRVGFQVLAVNSTKILDFDLVSLSDRPFAYWDINNLNNYQSWTPTGSWTANTTYQGWYKQINDDLNGWVIVSTSGAPTATVLTIDLPPGFNIDVAKINNPTSGESAILGELFCEDSSTGYFFGTVASNGSSNQLRCQYFNVSGSTIQRIGVSSTAPFSFGSGDNVLIKFSVPVTTSSRLGVITPESSTLVFGARIANNGATASITSQGPETFIESATRNGTGRVDIVWTTGFFTDVPTVVAIRERASYVAASSSEPTVHAITTSGCTISIGDSGATGAVDVNFTMMVMRQGNDAASASRALVARPIDRVAVLEHRENAGVEGGTFTADGLFKTRILNTLTGNDTSFVSLSSNQFTLTPGVYDIDFSGTAYQVGTHRTVIRNITDSTNDLLGDSAFSGAVSSVSNASRGRGTITITASKTFALQHRAEATKTTNGFGTTANFGIQEVYARVVIKKIR